MVFGFVIRFWTSSVLLFLSVIAFSGCGMSSILVEQEDAGEEIADAEADGSLDASDEEDGKSPGCGDGIIDGRSGEQCDGDVGGATCRSIQLPDGILRCDDQCRFDTSLCTGTRPFGDGGVRPFGDGGVRPFGDGGTRPFGDGGFFRPTRRDGGLII